MQPAQPGRRNVATGTSVAGASAEVAMLASTEPWEAQARRVPRRPGSKQEIQLERMLGGGDFDFGEFKSRSRREAQAPLLASSIPRDPVPAVLEAVVKFKQEASACVQKYLAERALPAQEPKEAPGPSAALSSHLERRRPSTRSIPREEPAGVAAPGSEGVLSGSREAGCKSLQRRCFFAVNTGVRTSVAVQKGWGSKPGPGGLRAWCRRQSRRGDKTPFAGQGEDRSC
ncbi:unnamed protein product [Symbiodinium necroappetens]|uniref:Uncharacterized protein n=1 Tax=Symbiodinium necroappetens TaxID=1628268 RepID=A0A812PHS2_9DINO|nr:unnamed protein product [Symbiodinium necroappetens]